MYLGILVLLAAVLVSVGALYVLSRLTAVARNPLVSRPFLSGWVPEEHALSRYHARYYPVTLLFLAFDVEMLFMYPWAAVVSRLGPGAVIEMFVFLGVLMAGVFWAWREGAFKWA
ncbi:NADH-quinone oxidoreductase subunit A [Paenarthrobacter sp. DKR-5]|uniref:NADH-quinone oxidoreductase subunit A n=1 Tax=Paenarthrobacter sp. DKR-5 TaxID=2835535 RepID=UPI001BDBB3CD|nr:NADH-quinone oxidoreductase subunit A [Paenarthrobacter sp. DKR-5]MBT1003898.1 NADH-quinone oxidoreductase subunit A [Paenarthrobacter sp. DKR-5]